MFKNPLKWLIKNPMCHSPRFQPWVVEKDFTSMVSTIFINTKWKKNACLKTIKMVDKKSNVFITHGLNRGLMFNYVFIS